jgi:hypothetical protein
MKNILSFKFPQLSTEDKVMLRQVLRAQRAYFLSEALAKIQTPDLSKSLGEQAAPISAFLKEMLSLSSTDPDLFWRILDHWATQFLLSALIPDFSQNRIQACDDRFTSNLTAVLLFERLRSYKPIDSPTTYTIRTDNAGRVHGLLHGVSLEFQDERFRGALVEFECLPGSINIRLQDNAEAFAFVLPLQDNALLKFVPLTLSEAGDFPVIDEPTIFGKYTKRVMENPETPEDAKAEKDVMPLENSLIQAQAIIERLWPEALDWAHALVPAFVDLGTPQLNFRLSLSYEPGSPIFMSKVNNYLFHAEDLVHELQHHRLYLFATPDRFKSWLDLTQAYISPYRTDPRHLRGLLLGGHAFLTVNELRKRRLLDGERGSLSLGTAMAETHLENLYAFRTVMEHETFDDLGRELFKDMAMTIAEHHSVVQPFLTPDKKSAIEKTISDHMAGVQKEAAELGFEIKNAAPSYRDWDETARLAANFS